MNITQTKRKLVEICHRVYANGFVAGYEGNLSVRAGREMVLVTPARVCKGDVTVRDLVTIDRKKARSRTSGHRPPARRPTAELEMHLMVYDARSDVEAVVHAHPPVATGFAVAGVPIPERALPEVIVTMGAIPLVPYAMPGTAELADAIREYVTRANAFLLSNHGVLTVGRTIEEAYYRMETVEQVAMSVLAARVLGEPLQLSDAQIAALEKLIER